VELVDELLDEELEEDGSVTDFSPPHPTIKRLINVPTRVVFNKNAFGGVCGIAFFLFINSILTLAIGRKTDGS